MKTNSETIILSTIPEKTTFAGPSEKSIIIESSETDSITNSLNTTNSKLFVMLYGYENYNYINNIISFRIYFIIFGSTQYPTNIYFSVSIIFSNYMRNLEETNLPANCSFQLEKDKLLAYNCEAKTKQRMNITNISANYDFDFQAPYELYVSLQASNNKDKLQLQTGDSILSKHLIILTGDLTQDKNYFSIEGELDNSYPLDNKFNLTLYDNQSSVKNSSCEINNNTYNDFQIKCNKDNLGNISINNSVSYMTNSQLLVIINNGQNDLLYQMNENNRYKHYFYLKKDKSLSPALIAIIVIILVLVIAAIIALIIKFRKKNLKTKRQNLYSADSNFNFELTNSKN